MGEKNPVKEYFKSKFDKLFIDLSNAEIPYIKKLKSILVKDFYLNFVQKAKCILNLFLLKLFLFLLVIIITEIIAKAASNWR